MFLRFFAAGLLALPSLACASASTLASPASGLIATLQVDCRRLGVTDELALTVTLRNAGAQPLVLYRQMGWGEGGGLGLRVTDFKGAELVAPAVAEAGPDPMLLADVGNYLTLLPQRSLQLVRHEAMAALVPGAGNYRVSVEYRSPVPAQDALPKSYFWSRESGVAATPALSLEVGEEPVCPASVAGG